MKLMPRYNISGFFVGKTECDVSPQKMGNYKITFGDFTFPFEFEVKSSIHISSKDYQYENWLISSDEHGRAMYFFSEEFDKLHKLMKTMKLDPNCPKTMRLIELNLGY